MAPPLPAIVTPNAQADVLAALDHYLEDGGATVAARFVASLQQAYALLGRQPGLGSLRYATLAGIPSLRAWPLRPWPYLVFYLPQERQLDILRVLHTARDLPATLAPDDA